jgi:hypothetical protein
MSKETYVKYIIGLTIQGQGFGLRIFSVHITHPHSFVRFLDRVIHQEVPKLFSQQELRGLVDKRTAQQSKLQQFETDRRQGLGFKKIFC